jgi:hypothetical protein
MKNVYFQKISYSSRNIIVAISDMNTRNVVSPKQRSPKICYSVIQEQELETKAYCS